MGRRTKPSSETEAEMEGSGDDHESLGLARIAVEFDKFQQSVNRTESTLVRHLDEYHETSRRGQAELSETLKRVDENLQIMNKNQSKLNELLTQVTHQGRNPDTYGNKEAGGSGEIHEEIRYNPEKVVRSEGSLDGDTAQGQMGSRVNQRRYIPAFTDDQLGRHSGSRANPRPYMPTFTDEQGQQEQVEEFVEQMERSAKEYYSLDMKVQRQMSLDQYCQLRFRNQPRTNHRGSFEFERRTGKIEIPYFDGTTKMTAQSWVQKLDTYLQLNPMKEIEAIKFATMYLDGKAHDWWYHGLTTLGHNQIMSYTEFTQRLIDRFDQGDPELHFRELTQLKQTSTAEVYIDEFQRLAVMVQDMSPTRLMMLFTEGLMEPLKGWVKAFKPTSLQEAIWKTRDLGPAAKPKFIPRPPLNNGGRDQRPPINQGGRDPKGFDRGRGRIDDNTRRELRRKQLCFTCKEPWNPSHKCMGRGQVHYIEVTSDNEEEDEIGQIQNMEAETTEAVEEEQTTGQDSMATLASISGVPKYNTFRMRGVLQGQRVSVLIDGGASHNFIDAALLKRRHIPTVEFEGFKVEVAGGSTIPCDRYIPGMKLTLGRHELIQDVYVMDLPDTNIILGVQWLSTLGPITTNYKTMEMSFTEEGGRKVVLRGMTGNAAKVVTAKRMEAIFRRDEIVYAVECRIVTRVDEQGKVHYTPEIKEILDRHHKVFGPIPPGVPPDRGFEHIIELEEGAKPVITTPYRHPKKYKDEIEKAIKELLDMGHIRPNNSPFASSVVLVKKKDGTMRMCIDFRALNKKTIKNRYPIPRIDELLDELHGAIYFTKIDLRSGYHQIKMREEDISKTAFRCHYGHYEFLVMPFGLTNAPATFQSCMNQVFNKQLRKYLLVFFDDLLIYSKTWEEHLRHVDQILSIMEEQSLYAKESKCEFGMTEVLYLGHIIGAKGVQVHQEKIQAIMEWPTPKTLTELRGFLGMCTYYRKFVKGFSQLCAPLTDLTKKGAFKWDEEAQITMDKMKEVMSTCPVLALPDFSLPFTLECDASGEGIGVVLMQKRHPLAYESRKLRGPELLYNIYDKEMLAIMHALAKFRQYLVGARFVVKSDHNSLKYLLEQKDLNERQQKWVSRIQAYDFDIEFVKGKNNVVVDALSRRPSIFAITGVTVDWKDHLVMEYAEDQFACQLLDGQVQDEDFKVINDLIYYKDRIFLVPGSTFKAKVLQACHDSPMAGHQGINKTYRQVRERFSWKGLKEDVIKHVKECTTCQANKDEHTHPAGLLQPLPIPEHKWESISMDFITGLPKTQGKDCIFVVVDRLTKFAHFFAIATDFSAAQVAELFFREIFRLHGLPKTIVSDRDSRFMSTFWQELFRLVGTALTPSTSYHPQTDGQTEIVNKWVEGYLRNYVAGQQKAWARWLHLGEYCYNTTQHMSIGMSPFRALYSYDPLSFVEIAFGDSRAPMVQDWIEQSQDILRELKDHLQRAQNQQKVQADKHRVDRTFEVGDLVYLRLQPYRQASIKRSGAEKLQPRFFGPYRVSRKIGVVAYELELPQGSKIHNIFHVSCLKKALGQHIKPIEVLPPMDEEGQLILIPEEILEIREKRLRNRSIKEYLIRWKDLPIEDATWEKEHVVREAGLELLEDKQFQAGETVMSPTS
jgi:hypothetical protein